MDAIRSVFQALTAFGGRGADLSIALWSPNSAGGLGGPSHGDQHISAILPAVNDGEYHDFPICLIDFVHDDVGPLDQLSRPLFPSRSTNPRHPGSSKRRI
jgi:hypothetical protein